MCNIKQNSKKINTKLIIDIILGIFAFTCTLLIYLDNRKTNKIVQNEKTQAEVEMKRRDSLTIKFLEKFEKLHQSQIELLNLRNDYENNDTINNLKGQIISNEKEIKIMIKSLCITNIRILDSSSGDPIPNVKLHISDMDTITDVNGSIRLQMGKNFEPNQNVTINAIHSEYEHKTVNERICNDITIRLNKKSK